MTGIYWIASYPKSGNTWMRLLMQSCQENGRIVDINTLSVAPMYATQRPIFDAFTGVASSDLTDDEILAWRPAVLRSFVESADLPLYAKTHEARLSLPDGTCLVPQDVTKGAVYMVRDPRDVAISLAAHADCSVDDAIGIMADDDMRKARSITRLQPALIECWASWSGHVESWLDGSGAPVHLLHYEALCADPATALAKALPILGLHFSQSIVRRAAANCALDILRAQERSDGFRERRGAAPFFREGRPGGWKRILSDRQAARIEADHGPIMRRLGYLDADY